MRWLWAAQARGSGMVCMGYPSCRLPRAMLRGRQKTGRCQQVAKEEAAGVQQRSIHVAGTNGKGTVSSTIAKCLENAGYKVGLFTSPWVIDYREQIQINGEFIPKNVFADYVDEYKDSDTTEFELLTGIMYKYFADSHVDYAVIECGMGGKGAPGGIIVSW